MKKILITGAGGQLAWDCGRVLADRYQLTALDSSELDIADQAAVQGCLTEITPDIVINCAAYTKVDACESDEELVRRVNVNGPANLAKGLVASDGLLVHLSTDYVFDGLKKVPEAYLETDPHNPLSVYGRSKSAAEQLIRTSGVRYLIIRTSWLYGRHGRNFLKTILRLALQDPGRELRVVNDQTGCLTWTYRLAKQIDALLEVGAEGTYHAAAEGAATWYEVACRFLAMMEVPHRVTPCTTEQYPTPARRPVNSILANARLTAESLNLMRPWQEDLGLFVSRYGADLLKEVSENLSPAAGGGA